MINKEASKRLEAVNWIGIAQCCLYLIVYGIISLIIYCETGTEKQAFLRENCSLAIISTFILLGLTITQQVMIRGRNLRRSHDDAIMSVLCEISFWSWVAMHILEWLRIFSGTDRLLYGAMWIVISLLEAIFLRFAQD